MCIALTYILVNLLASVVLGEELLTLPLDPDVSTLYQYKLKTSPKEPDQGGSDYYFDVYEFQEVLRLRDEDGSLIESV